MPPRYLIFRYAGWAVIYILDRNSLTVPSISKCGRSHSLETSSTRSIVPSVSKANRRPQSFIVHGHDETAKLALKNFLQNILKFP